MTVYELEIFPRWSRAWRKHDGGIESHLRQVRQLLERRNAGRSRPPRLDLVQYVGHLKEFASLSESLATTPALSRADRRRLVRAARQVAPVVDAGMWARWLELEVALNVCLREDDVLAAAILLRTLAEEAGRGQLLRQVCDGLLGKAPADHSADALRGVCNALWDFGLPRMRPRSLAELEAGGDLAALGRVDSSIERVFSALNDYVHPNYGSHQVVVDPSRVKVGAVLLESIAAIYQEFLARPWLDSPAQPDRRSRDGDGRGAIGTIEQVLEQMHSWAERTKPDDQRGLQALADYVERSGSAMDLDHGEIDTGALTQVMVQVELEELIDHPFANTAGWPAPLQSPLQRWQWLLVRRAGDELEGHVSQGEGVPQRLIAALNLFGSVAELKATALTTRAIRFIEADLGLAAAVCARSVFEHHAVAVWLAQKAHGHVEALARRKSLSELGALEKQVARCLAGTKASQEDASAWKCAWDGLFGEQAINLMEVVKSLGSNAASHYDYLSGVVHGFAVTGADLLGGAAAHPVRMQLRVRAGVALGLCNSFEAKMQGIPMLAYQKLDWLGQALSHGESPGNATGRLQQPGKLKFGRDVRGRGTEEEPYRFREGLNYYEAFGRFLEEQAIDGDRSVWVGTHGVGDRVDAGDGRVFFFVANPPGASLATHPDGESREE